MYALYAHEAMLHNPSLFELFEIFLDLPLFITALPSLTPCRLRNVDSSADFVESGQQFKGQSQGSSSAQALDTTHLKVIDTDQSISVISEFCTWKKILKINAI